MQRINIKGLIGQNAVTLDDGEIIYNLIHESLMHGDVVELDFDGVEIFASPFFNAGVGRLLVDLKPDTLNQQLKFDHLSDFGSRVLRRVIDNAKEYYASSTAQRNKVDQVLTSDFLAA
ncbi:STAS-like domain-containing protein [Methylotenera sp.]|uniref:STAS-like domain-containing protein n=1 Tax=Methylotenera sp. TaxID=2051956 RepID=UPI002487D0D1|nr:STAS-like domain-containing protein [Methylotenera sp.]MDI1363152.1 STAS-like domain-containing protein [Methylotenera sp.]